VAPSRDSISRFGVIVPKHNHKVVARNLVKRRLRELMRQWVVELPLSRDVLILAGPRAYGATFAKLGAELAAAWRRAAAQ
jgi:ribonuclease P protein component